jgi:hypothetical protein
MLTRNSSSASHALWRCPAGDHKPYCQMRAKRSEVKRVKVSADVLNELAAPDKGISVHYGIPAALSTHTGSKGDSAIESRLS